jgi:hypothetical protein
MRLRKMSGALRKARFEKNAVLRKMRFEKMPF